MQTKPIGFATEPKPKTKKFWVVLTRETEQDQIDLGEFSFDVSVPSDKARIKEVVQTYLNSIESDGDNRIRAIQAGIPSPTICLAVTMCRAYLRMYQDMEQGPTVPNQLFLETVLESQGVREVVGRFASFNWADEYFGGQAIRAKRLD